jgi:hypothetical protein
LPLACALPVRAGLTAGLLPAACACTAWHRRLEGGSCKLWEIWALRTGPSRRTGRRGGGAREGPQGRIRRAVGTREDGGGDLRLGPDDGARAKDPRVGVA